MSDPIQIVLQPLGKRIEVEAGSSLQDVLFPHGVEFPCGGQGRCRGCRVRVIEGDLKTEEEEEPGSILSSQERAAGWRMACRCRATGDVCLEVAQWETAPILGDDSRIISAGSAHAEGYGVAIDLGTTTIAGQLIDLSRGEVRAVRTALNPQAKHGTDIMTRVEFGLNEPGRITLQSLVRNQLGELISDLIQDSNVSGGEIVDVVIVGNTVMHHLFCGYDMEPLSHLPFETPTPGMTEFQPADLGWNFLANGNVRFLPCLGSFVGSDILAGILASRMHESADLIALADLGTNGEIAIGNRDRILCASTAAGPAFEGARISMGMRAATGAISQVVIRKGAMHGHVLGPAGSEPRGICGSGLVDAVAAGLDLGSILPSGRLADGGKKLVIAKPVSLTQTDIREFQLAKGAISAGIRILLQRWGATDGELQRVFLAGAFGNYLNLASAQRIGLIDFPRDKVESIGNAALIGAKIVLFENLSKGHASWESIPERVKHLELGSDPDFMDAYVEEMTFPDRHDPVECGTGFQPVDPEISAAEPRNH